MTYKDPAKIRACARKTNAEYRATHRGQCVDCGASIKPTSTRCRHCAGAERCRAQKATPTDRSAYHAQYRAEHRQERRATQSRVRANNKHPCARCGQLCSEGAEVCNACAGQARAAGRRRKQEIRRQARQALVWLAKHEHVELRYQGRTIRVVLSQRMRRRIGWGFEGVDGKVIDQGA
jgi:hypothetical protein